MLIFTEHNGIRVGKKNRLCHWPFPADMNQVHQPVDEMNDGNVSAPELLASFDLNTGLKASLLFVSERQLSNGKR